MHGTDEVPLDVVIISADAPLMWRGVLYGLKLLLTFRQVSVHALSRTKVVLAAWEILAWGEAVKQAPLNGLAPSSVFFVFGEGYTGKRNDHHLFRSEGH